ncbi:MAG: RNA polymerase II transcription factor B subunit 4 [Chrysothrix sp. TS-e1954]|nr:MAG: RNA polymerase II transcription factor B subunit 4 [Chrysothrix sp. TS-e1954]
MDAIDGTSQSQRPSDSPPPSLLVVILDTNPHAWASLAPTLPLSKALGQLLIFINAHLAFSHENRVAVIASHCQKAQFLYPRPTPRSPPTSNGTSKAHVNGDAKTRSTPAPAASANKYRPFALVESTVNSALKDLIDSTTTQDIENTYTTQIAGALTLALTYINRIALSFSTSHGAGGTNPSTGSGANADSAPARPVINSRLLVVSTSGDLAAQYIPLMNSMFAAQHSRVLVDVLKLAGDTVLLQQASFTTGGIFISPEIKQSQPIALLPYLLHALLPDAHARQHLYSPTNPHVDFRAACFCHRRVVSIGYVCSICLSIFCEELPDGTCLTCGTKLVLRRHGGEGLLDGDGSGKKKEKKKKKKREAETERTVTAA